MYKTEHYCKNKKIRKQKSKINFIIIIKRNYQIKIKFNFLFTLRIL